jgi:uncharacterized protein YceK
MIPANRVALLAFSAILSACASIDKSFVDPPSGGSQAYAGVRTDYQYLSLGCKPPADFSTCNTLTHDYISQLRAGDDQARASLAMLSWFLPLADLPLSAVTDTLLLPYTLSR